MDRPEETAKANIENEVSEIIKTYHQKARKESTTAGIYLWLITMSIGSAVAAFLFADVIVGTDNSKSILQQKIEAANDSIVKIDFKIDSVASKNVEMEKSFKLY